MSEPQVRAECPIKRLHNRFLLRQLEFTQQYASMYRRRIERQHDVVLKQVQKSTNAPCCRVLELKPNETAICVGVLYKEMKLLPRFLNEYQKELVRTDAGDEDNDGEELLEEEIGVAGAEEAKVDASVSREQAAQIESYSVCHAQDELYIEDDSGRVLLGGINADKFCTGIILGVCGTLHANGVFEVLSYKFSGLESCYVPRPVPTSSTPCYVAVVSGLEVTLPSQDTSTSLGGNRLRIQMLMDFLGGRLGDATLLEHSKNISRLVIGGNSIAPTEELKLKKKVKLDPSDHVRLNADKSASGVVTSAQLMKELDQVLECLAKTVEVEVMPGDNDMSDAFFPQQPLHPLLLPNASRYSSLRLVTNPTEFVALTAGNSKEHVESDTGVRFFISSGQNVNDVARETRCETRLDTFEVILQSANMCPTAPNTLFSYPFREKDPFLFDKAPHCFIACDQPVFETRFSTLEKLRENTENAVLNKAAEGATKVASESSSSEEGIRMVCVPPFHKSGAVVLVNINSPTLETFTVTLGG